MQGFRLCAFSGVEFSLPGAVVMFVRLFLRLLVSTARGSLGRVSSALVLRVLIVLLPFLSPGAL